MFRPTFGRHTGLILEEPNREKSVIKRDTAKEKPKVAIVFNLKAPQDKDS